MMSMHLYVTSIGVFQDSDPLKFKARYDTVNPLPSSGILCHLLITFSESLDPDQARRFVGPDPDSNCLTL